jgi:hypothetical protein
VFLLNSSLTASPDRDRWQHRCPNFQSPQGLWQPASSTYRFLPGCPAPSPHAVRLEYQGFWNDASLLWFMEQCPEYRK